jgi:hypothetical protein
MPGSITSVLSSALASALTFPVQDNDTPRRDFPVAVTDATHHEHETKKAQSASCQANVKCATRTVHRLDPGPVDFVWLRERCGGDDELVLEVLRNFFEQGQCHIDSMQSSIKEMDITKIMFHSVNLHLVSTPYTFTDIPCRVQNFLAGSASNIGAWILEERCQELYKTAHPDIVHDPVCFTAFQHLLAQVLECCAGSYRPLC